MSRCHQRIDIPPQQTLDISTSGAVAAIAIVPHPRRLPALASTLATPSAAMAALLPGGHATHLTPPTAAAIITATLSLCSKIVARRECPETDHPSRIAALSSNSLCGDDI